MKYLIKINNFKKKYKDIEVFVDDLKINNRVTLLVGKNGCGKSTIMRSIIGLIKFEGDIMVNGKVSYMSEFSHFPGDLTVYQFIKSLKQISNTNLSDKNIDYLLKIFMLENKEELLLSSLSKGMKAKVNLVQCLMEESDIYLLDEPMSGIDKDGVKNLVKYINESKKSFVISTHLIDDFEKLSKEIIYL